MYRFFFVALNVDIPVSMANKQLPSKIYSFIIIQESAVSPTFICSLLLLSPVIIAADCVPDPAEFDANSDMGRLVSKMQRMFQDAQPTTTATSAENDRMTDILTALGLKVGDKVMVGGVKVSVKL